eukprot:scaffold32_cov144-Skeletonema_menzelii.AAC.10
MKIGLSSRVVNGKNITTEEEFDKEKVPLNITDADPPADELSTKDSSYRNLWSAKNASLFSLVLQQSGLVLMIRYSRVTGARADHISYIPSVVVVSAEVLKFLLNLTLEITVKQPDGTNTESTEEVLKSMVNMESLKLLVPALLYLIQNNLLFVALKNLSVPVYQVLNQGKLFTTAFFSRLLLDKKISYCQYFSLLMLATGVVVVQQSANKDHTNNNSSSTQEGSPWVLKQKSASKQLSVYARNIQLAFWSIGLGVVPIFMTGDWEKAFTGLLVGYVMKYADAVLKGFATSVAVVLATILSIVIFNDNVNLLFLVGATLVVLAVRTYTNYPPVESAAAAKV